MANNATAHYTPEEAEEEAMKMTKVYHSVDEAAMPVVVGCKSRAETFTGAVCTYTIVAMMRDC